MDHWEPEPDIEGETPRVNARYLPTTFGCLFLVFLVLLVLFVLDVVGVWDLM